MFYNKTNIKSDFSKITISLASPDTILDNSYGEVLKSETINYRTYKPERDGLFCERIFGPIKDYECSCGKYKRIRYKGTVCERCGVEVTEKKVRRYRMGHIKLAVPVVHIWYFKSLPNKIGYLLGMPSKEVDLVIYYEKYIVIQTGVMADKFKKGQLISEEEYQAAIDALSKTEEGRNNRLLPDEDPEKFIAKMGAEAIHDLLAQIDIDALSYELRTQASQATSKQKKTDLLKRLSVVEAFKDANTRIKNRPEWMVLKYLPIIPPDLRPLVAIDGGRFASSDLNDLYRRIIIRNNRLKRLIEIKAPEVILRNEKRMLQESMDALFDNSKKTGAIKADGGRPLKSLSDALKGKQGRFRQNLLGKRVDYSGRSVIVVGPELKLHECGLPKDMALELFKPFVVNRLIQRGIVKTLKSAYNVIEKKDAVVWDILENIMNGRPVLLNRAPTLHRLSIQAFQPKIIEGKAIQLHPLVCAAFNADFDGDQMAVHVPISNRAIVEAQLLMLSSHNILNPQNGSPVTLPSQDMVLGLYYMTQSRKSEGDHKIKGEGKIFYSADEVEIAYNEKMVDLHANIKVRVKVRDPKTEEIVAKIIDTTVGRVLFNKLVPENVGFFNELLTKKSLRDIIGKIIQHTDIPTTVEFLDNIKKSGFMMAFRGGLSFNISDLIVPEMRENALKKSQEEVDEVWNSYNMGLITNTERYNQIVDIWSRSDMMITESLMQDLAKDKQGFNSVYMMLDSGARGSKQQIKQLCGIRGLMAKPRKSSSSKGSEIIENPILSNFKSGLSVLEYFISTHGARKGLADTALKTADAGYLTRRLVDVAQDVIILEEDCKTIRGIQISALKDNEEIVESLKERIVGRITLEDVYDPTNDELILHHGELITESIADKIERAGIESVEIRSVLTCESKRGVCVKCYGINLANGKLTQMGDTVGVIAAQSIGEPGTQLTLRTFHVGGIAGSSAVESEMPARFEGVAVFDGVRTVTSSKKSKEQREIVIGRMGEIRIMNEAGGRTLSTHHVPYGAILSIKNGAKVAKGDIIFTWDPYNNVIISDIEGEVVFEDIIEGITFKEEIDEQTGHKEKVVIETKDKNKIPSITVKKSGAKESKTYNLPVGSHIIVKEGDQVETGQVLVKIQRVIGKLRDITGGLPRVTELFEARNPENAAIVSEIDGIIAFGGLKRGNREIIVTGKSGIEKKYLIPLSRQILVQEGDYIYAGNSLSDGKIAPSDILFIKGVYAVQEYLVNEIQEVYRLQGVKLNDKHIEVIVRQMLKKVEIQDSGDTRFLQEDVVDRVIFIKENDRIYTQKVITDAGDSSSYKIGQMVTLKDIRDENSILRRNDKKIMDYRDAEPAVAKPVLLGITKASLGSTGWISAASFQETTKVLSFAAINGKTDELLGLKENVITGNLVLAGTSLPEYRDLIVINRDDIDSEVPEEIGEE